MMGHCLDTHPRFGGMRMPPSIEGDGVERLRCQVAVDSAACACRPPLKDEVFSVLA